VGGGLGFEELAIVFCFSVGSLPLNYLDLLFGSPFKAIVVWKRISRRINGSWQVRRNCTFLKEEGLLPSKACIIVYQSTFSLFMLFLLTWLINFLNYKRFFFL
jgi:hypothetical protein